MCIVWIDGRKTCMTIRTNRTSGFCHRIQLSFNSAIHGHLSRNRLIGWKRKQKRSPYLILGFGLPCFFINWINDDFCSATSIWLMLLLINTKRLWLVSDYAYLGNEFFCKQSSQIREPSDWLDTVSTVRSVHSWQSKSAFATLARVTSDSIDDPWVSADVAIVNRIAMKIFSLRIQMIIKAISKQMRVKYLSSVEYISTIVYELALLTKCFWRNNCDYSIKILSHSGGWCMRQC